MSILNDFLEFRKAKKLQKRTTNIIKEYYGGNMNLFVWNYAKQIYNIPEVRNAINTVAEIFSTIPIYHKIVSKNGDVRYLENDDVNFVLSLKANPLQNSISFWQSCINRLLLENNLFIEPVYEVLENGIVKLRQLYVLPYKHFNFRLEQKEGFVDFSEEPKSGVKKSHNMNDLIYISRFCNFGGGKANDLGLYQTVIQALSEKIVNVCSPKKVRALLQSSLTGQGQLKDRDKKGTMAEVQANFDNNVEGLAYLDSKWQVTPINWQENDVNRDLMSFVINVVYNYFGITENILNCKATETEMEMFINKTMKPLALQFEREFTSKLFTQREIEVGHRVEFDVFALSVSTLQAKTNLLQSGIRNGYLSQDDAREYLGQPPLPDGMGKKYRMSADCVDISIIDDYQLGKFNITTDTNKVSTTEEVEDINNLKKEDSDGEN